jgi:hypothetical protein
MSQQSGFTTPEVNGTFNGCGGNCFQMSDVDGDNIWEATADLRRERMNTSFRRMPG